MELDEFMAAFKHDPEPREWRTGDGWSELGQTDRIVRFENGRIIPRRRPGYVPDGGATLGGWSAPTAQANDALEGRG